jgi:hypothetical protein
MNGSARGGTTETGYIVRTLHEMTRLAQEAESMLPGFDRQMRVVGDAAAAAQLDDAYKEYKAVQDALDRTWAQLEPTMAAVLEAHPELAPPR